VEDEGSAHQHWLTAIAPRRSQQRTLESYDWTRLLQLAGVRHVRLHDGRYTAATLLLSENVHPRVVMELLGHSQMRTTMDIYTHVMPALAREAADRMGALLLPGKGQADCNHNCNQRRLRPPSRRRTAWSSGWS
jgi:integrase